MTSLLYPHGIFRITTAAPKTAVANPAANAKASIAMVRAHSDSDLVVLPELGLTGYTCGDLFASEALLDKALEAVLKIQDHSKHNDQIIIVGLPMRVSESLMNCAAVITGGMIVGVVPKSFLPTYREFYEGRHFRCSGQGDPAQVTLGGANVPFGTDLIFRRGSVSIAVEICEDFWTPQPPSSAAAVAGANVLVNLSASNETIGKASWRRDLIRSQSGRCIAAYAYASAGPGESTADLVFGGHCLIAENGVMLAESRRVGDGVDPVVTAETSVTVDIDLDRINHDRRVVGSFDDMRNALGKQYRVIDLDTPSSKRKNPRTSLLRYVDAHPFVPNDAAERDDRCAEILGMQVAGLVKRFSRLPETLPLSIGISGGLDSTLAFLIALRACKAAGRDVKTIHSMTMPGFGTTQHTRASADALIQRAGTTGECIDIRQLCLDTFRSMDHSPLGISIDDRTTVQSLQKELLTLPDDATDLVFENVQARIRTMLLMTRGFVIGTGDMSEQALGWCTYNADHMSMYNVNTSIPKTLVRYLVRYLADHDHDEDLRKVLHRVADTPISPELLPPDEDGEIRQSTEDSIGTYELHDFFLYHFVRNGFSREKILYLARHAKFNQEIEESEIEATLDIFVKRFFSNQFKRNCVPDGPKVGSVSLSPRGDWRMPSDADSDAF